MPERSEVQIIVNQLNKEFNNQTLHNVEVIGGKFIKTGIQGLNNIKFPLHNTQFYSSGKFIYWLFKEDVVVFNHLGMAASFGYPSKHSAIRFTFDKNKIDFIDIRHFGNFKFATKKELEQKLSSLGWDILQEDIPNNFITNIRKQNSKTIAEILLNQKYFNGCGNYLRSECLYHAKIHPLRTISSLSDTEIILICKKLQNVVQEAYNAGGATIVTFKDMYGNTGKFFDNFKVYSKKQTSDGKPVRKIIAPDGRSVFFVEGIQI